MKLKSIFEYHKPGCIDKRYGVALQIKQNQGNTYTLQKTYIAIALLVDFCSKRKYDSLNPKKAAKPFCVDQVLNEKEYLSFLDLICKKNLADNINELNDFLDNRILMRVTQGFRLVENRPINLLNELCKIAINKLDESFTDNSLPSYIKKLDSLDTHFKVYNVGQACCSSVDINSINESYTYFFDFGCVKSNHKLFRKLTAVQNATIFISHLHCDHINQITKLYKIKRNKIQIFFPYTDFDDLTITGKVFVVGSLLDGYNYIPLKLGGSNKINLKNISILQGQHLNHYPNSKLNSQGLIFLYRNNKGSLLIPGDVMYYNFPIEFNANKIILPHHGCSLPSKFKISNLDLNTLEEAFVFCGPSKAYHHPNKEHLEQIFTNNVKIYRFENEKNRCIFNRLNQETADNVCHRLTGDSFNFF